MKMKCPKCGKTYLEQTNYCKYCGAPLQSFINRQKLDSNYRKSFLGDYGKDISYDVKKKPINKDHSNDRSNILLYGAMIMIILAIIAVSGLYFIRTFKSSNSSGSHGSKEETTSVSSGDYKITAETIETESETSVEINTEEVNTGDVEISTNMTTLKTFPDNAIYNSENGHHYLVSNEPMNWDEADEACRSQNGHLATVTSSKEQDFIRHLIEEQGEQYHYWLGGTDKDDEGRWRWVTGEEWTYENWEYGQPNNDTGYDANGQNYLEVQATYGDNGSEEYMTWTDMAVDGVSPADMEEPEYNSTPYYGYICEWDE